MNVWKKLGALTVVIVLAMSFCVMASAAQTLTNGVGKATVAEGETYKPGTKIDKSVTINKSIKMFNTSETAIGIKAPTISYAYSIKAVKVDGEKPGKTITDGAGVKVVTQNPPDTLPSLTGTGTKTVGDKTVTVIEWAPSATESVSASKEGVDDTKSLTVNFDAVSFGAAGVYRYEITETITGAAYTAAGVTDVTSGATGEGDRTEALYLDVYVRDAEDGETERQIYGYVLAKVNEDQPNSTTPSKVSTFTTDEYHTGNVKVSFELLKDAAMNSHTFLFHVVFTNSSVTGNVLLMKSENGGTATVHGTPRALTDTNTSDFLSLSNGKYVTYIGVPTDTVVKVYETNNATGSTYSIEVNNGKEEPTSIASKKDGVVWAENAPSEYVVFSTQGYNSNEASVTTTEDADFEAHFINTLQLISPTGVTLRYAPYLLTLGAGIVALPLSRSFKRREDF